MIYLSYFLGNLAVMRARHGRVAEGSAPVQARGWGPIVNVAGARLRRCHARQLRLASRRATRRPNQTLGSLSLGSAFPQQDPDPLHRAGVILIIGVIYYGLFETRKTSRSTSAAETGAVEIPPESLPPDELA